MAPGIPAVGIGGRGRLPDLLGPLKKRLANVLWDPNASYSRREQRSVAGDRWKNGPLEPVLRRAEGAVLGAQKTRALALV